MLCYLYHVTIGTWRENGVMLMVDGKVTEEQLVIPECARTISVEWYSTDDRVCVFDL